MHRHDDGGGARARASRIRAAHDYDETWLDASARALEAGPLTARRPRASRLRALAARIAHPSRARSESPPAESAL
jgi:hypothetical protein